MQKKKKNKKQAGSAPEKEEQGPASWGRKCMDNVDTISSLSSLTDQVGEQHCAGEEPPSLHSWIIVGGEIFNSQDPSLPQVN